MKNCPLHYFDNNIHCLINPSVTNGSFNFLRVAYEARPNPIYFPLGVQGRYTKYNEFIKF